MRDTHRLGMRLKDVSAEYRSVGIGPLLLNEVREVVSSVVWSYDPIVYGGVWSWDEGVEDLVQEFCLEVLIEQGQIDYAMLVAVDHQHFRRLLARQVRHHLAKRRRRSIIDNLLDRCKELVCSSPFQIATRRRGWCYTLEGKSASSEITRPADLKEIAASLARLPFARSNPVVRAPMIYTTETLGDLLKIVAEASPRWVTVRDLHSIFSLLLTSWLPSFLEKNEKKGDRADVRELDAEEETMVKEATCRIVANCTADHLELLGMKLAGRPDTSIASHYGVSRPTVMRRKAEILRILQEALAGHADRVREEVMNRLGARLVEKVVETDGE